MKYNFLQVYEVQFPLNVIVEIDRNVCFIFNCVIPWKDNLWICSKAYMNYKWNAQKLHGLQHFIKYKINDRNFNEKK